MPSVIWNDRLKIVVSELTRGSQLQVWQRLADTSEDLNILDYTRNVYSEIMVAACRAIYVREDIGWRALNQGQSATVNVDEDVSFTITFPPPVEQLNELPVTLTNEWSEKAEGANRYMIDLIFFQGITPNATPTNSEPPSASES